MNKFQTISKEAVSISLSLAIIDFLLDDDFNSRNGKKKNRFYAFADLVNRCFIATIQGESTEQSYLSLMTAWNWPRTALGKFLTGLEKLGAVELTTSANKKFAKITPKIFSESHENVSDGQLSAKHISAKPDPQNLNSGEKNDERSART